MRLVIALVLLAGCGDDKGTAPPPDLTDDSDEPAPDTSPPDETGDTEPQPVDRDTGVTFVMFNEGSATVLLEEGLRGQDATVFRWESKDDVISGPRCIYARDIIDWANDPVRFGVADPLGEHHFDDDPFHEDTDFCRGCTFSFTITYKNEREVAQLPWDDTPPGDPPEGDGPLLSCENLREWASLPEPDATASGHIGYGFNPTLGDPTDPTSGALMLWDMFNGAWVPLTYDAHFSEGTLTWSSRLRSYTVTY
jgi:hypothetical protein